MLNRDNGWDGEALVFSDLGVRFKIEKVVGALHHLYVRSGKWYPSKARDEYVIG